MFWVLKTTKKIIRMLVIAGIIWLKSIFWKRRKITHKNTFSLRRIENQIAHSIAYLSLRGCLWRNKSIKKNIVFGMGPPRIKWKSRPPSEILISSRDRRSLRRRPPANLAYFRTKTIRWPTAGGLNHLPYLLSAAVSLSVIKDFSTNYITALGLNQASSYVFSLARLYGWFSIDTEKRYGYWKRFWK